MVRIPLRSTIPKQTTPIHKAQHLTPTTQLTNDYTNNTEFQSPCTNHNTSRASMWGSRRVVSVSGVQVQFSGSRTDGRNHLHNTIICCKAAYGNQPRCICGSTLRSTCRKLTVRARPDASRDEPTESQPRGTDRESAESHRPDRG